MQRRALRLIILFPAMAVALAAFAQGADEDAVPPGTKPSPDVGLDRLLTLPEDFDASVTDRRGGATPDQWRNRFRRAREDLDQARVALRKAQEEMESLAGDSASYQVAAPGTTTPETSPVSFRLREEIRRQRESVEQGERELRALEIEADLAEVPDNWRQ